MTSRLTRWRRKTQSENTAARFKAIGWDVQTIVDGHDLAAILKAFNRAKKAKSGRPQLIIAKTIIGKGIPEVQGTSKGHGEGGAKFRRRRARGTRPAGGAAFLCQRRGAHLFCRTQAAPGPCLPTVDQGLRGLADRQSRQGGTARQRHDPAERRGVAHQGPALSADAKLATRAAGRDVLQPLAAALPLLVSGSADLHGSTLNYIAADQDFDRTNRTGRNLRYGIREHAMAAINNGVAYDGLFRPTCATFLVFADYSRPSMRLAALAHLPVVYIYTHDSVGVGEDGPTHQPVETISALRLIPGLDVIRPADPEETAGAFAAAMERTDGPTLLALTRQTVRC